MAGCEPCFEHHRCSSTRRCEWIAEWNKKTASLRSRQGEGGGARGRLTAEQFEELCRKLRSEQRLWTTRELQEYLQERWGVRYSLRQVRRIARRCGLGYRKPYVLDERRPEDAELQLKRVLRKVVNGLANKGIAASDVAIGYADESSPQTRCNRVRYWSYGDCRVRDYHQKWRCNTFGFYAIRGKSGAGLSVIAEQGYGGAIDRDSGSECGIQASDCGVG
ncbi:MAG: transposase [Chlorobi bacterium]|nr:transposase [Chlorobiota bacterium]